MKSKLILFILIFFIIKTLNAQQKDSTYTLSEVEINSSKLLRSFNLEKIDLKNSLVIKNDIGEIIKNQPNISAIRKGGTAIDPVFRGYRNNQLLIMLDNGIRIEGGCPNRMDPVTSHIDADEIENINILHGADILNYGPAIGGVITVNSFQPQAFEKWTFKTKIKSSYESNFNGLSNSALIYGGNKTIFFSVSGAYKNYGNYTDGNNNEFSTSFKKYYTSLKLGYKITQNQTLRINFTNSQGRDIMFPALPMDEKKDNTQLYSINYSYTKNNSEKFGISLYHNDVEHYMDNSFRKQYSEIVPPLTGLMQAFSDVNALTTGLNTNYKFIFHEIYFQLNTDIDHIYKNGNRKRSMIMNMNGLQTISTKYDNLWKDAHLYNAGISLGIKKEIKNGYKLQVFSLKIRYDINAHYSSDTFLLKQNSEIIFDKSRQNNSYLSFGLDYSIEFNEKNQFKLGLSRLLRSANMNELYIKRMPVAFDNYDYLGNPFLKAEKNYQLDLKYLNNNTEKSNFAINFFASVIDDYIGSEILPPAVISSATQGVIGVKQYKNLDRVYFIGGEFVYNQLLYKYLNINLSAGYTYAFLKNAVKYVISNNQVVKQELIKNDPLPEIPPMDVNLNISYKFKNQTIIPLLNIRYITSQNNVSIANYEQTTPDWLIVNLSVDYKLNSNIKTSLGFKNLMNQDYYEHLNRKIIGSTEKLYEPGRSFFVNLIISI